MQTPSWHTAPAPVQSASHPHAPPTVIVPAIPGLHRMHEPSRHSLPDGQPAAGHANAQMPGAYSGAAISTHVGASDMHCSGSSHGSP
jgi:hypothetical protein